MGPKYIIQLLPTRSQVSRINTAEFKRLPGEPVTFDCVDYHSWRKDDHPHLANRFTIKYPGRVDGPLKSLDDHRLEETVQFKLGTVVLLLVNLAPKDGLVSGTQGQVVDYAAHSDTTAPLPDQVRGYGHIKATQVRVFMDRAQTKCYPVVRFQNGLTRTVSAVCTLTELGPREPYSLIGRTQIPLLPAWAITVHKSQGMTLFRVAVDLARSFEREMVYVALSRAKSLEGLMVKSLPAGFGDGMDKQVARFYREQFGMTAG